MTTSKGGGSGRPGKQTKRPKTIDLKAEKEFKPAGAAVDPGKSQGEEPAKAARSAVPNVKSTEKPLPPQPGQPKSAGAETVEERASKPSKDAAAGGVSAGGKTESAHASAKPGPSENPPKDGERKNLAASLVSGAAGGILALGVAGLLFAAGVLGPDTQSDPAGDSRLTELNSELDALQGKVTALEGSKPEADSAEIGAISGRVDDLETRLGQLQEDLASISQTAGEPQGDPDFATALNNSLMEDFEQRISAAEEKLQNLQSGAIQSGEGGEIVEGAALAQLRSELQSTSANTATALEGYDARMGALSERADMLESRIGELSDALSQLREQDSARSGSQDRIARSVAANALRTAYERGEPFSSLLASVQALTGELEEAAALEAQGRNGVPTMTELRSEFAAIAGGIINAAQPGEDGMVAQLLSNARSLVRVRPEGPLPGDSPEAIVSRIEDRLEKSDLAGALDERQSLPDAAKQFSSEWAAHVATRLEADKKLEAVLAALQADNATAGQTR